MRWSLSRPLSATSVLELLAERGIDVSTRTVLRWVQVFEPLLAAQGRRHRWRLGNTCDVHEVFCLRGRGKRSLYRAVDEHGQVVDVLFREHREHRGGRGILPAGAGAPFGSAGQVQRSGHC